ncbi:MAG TPA: sialidase family protein [Candidatus Brocadiia bacterium]|nr:sialidase family protein [Candidatus Brocadiia bacterium]
MQTAMFGLAAVGILVAATAASAGDAVFEDVHAVKMQKNVYGYRGSNGDFVRLKDGAILYCYTNGGIVARKSSDLGKTWGDESTLVPAPKPPAGGYICHPSFLRLKNGNILLSYIYSTYPATPYHGHNYYRLSADEGATWTEQYLMTPYPGYCIVHNDRILTLSTGRILAMAEYKAHFPSSNDHGGYVGMSFYSDNDGLSWYPSKNTVDMTPVEVQEADAVELKDGGVMMFARTYSEHPVRAYSADGGETWSKGEVIKELEMPCAGLPTVRRIPRTGDLLFIWISEKANDKQDPKILRRCALTSAISRDDGKTFENLRHIRRDPEDDFGYQCVEFVGDDLALVGYHARDGLHVARIGIDWFYGKPEEGAK